MKAWILAARPKTLAAAVVPIVVGTALAAAVSGSYSLWIVFFAVLSAGAIQVATNILNDALDFRKGADREDRLGPLRVTQSGLVSERGAFAVGFFFLFVALIFGIPLVMAGGWPIVIVGLASLFFAYGYTGGPLPLAYKGLGDLFVFIFFGIVAVGGVFFIQAQAFYKEALVAGAQVGFFCTVLIAINNLRDVEQDRISKKKTLAVRWGKNFVRYEIAALFAAGYLINFYWASQGFLLAAVLSWLTLPFAIHIISAVFKSEPSQFYNILLARSAQLHLIFGVLLSFGFLLRGFHL